MKFRKCLREDCHFWHLRGTARKETVPDINTHLSYGVQPVEPNAHYNTRSQIQNVECRPPTQNPQQVQNAFLERWMEQMKKNQELFQQQLLSRVSNQLSQVGNHLAQTHVAPHVAPHGEQTHVAPQQVAMYPIYRPTTHPAM